MSPNSPFIATWLYLYNSVSVPEKRFGCCTDIVLVNCNIDDAAAHTLSCGNLLREVSLQCNSVGNMGIIALANAEAMVSNLTKLDLQGNDIDDERA